MMPMRAAVNVDDERILLRSIEIGWLVQPSFDGEAVAVDRYLFDLRRGRICKESFIGIEDDACFAGFQPGDDQLAWAICVEARLHDDCAGSIDAEAGVSCLP